VTEAELEDSGSGLAPVGAGWFILNVRDAGWFSSDWFGSVCRFESRDAWFRQVGINLRVLEPGQPNGFYHSESQQEAALVLSGECRLLVNGEERLLRQWDFFHCPAGAEHVCVGAGDGPCVILMVGARTREDRGRRDSLPRLAARCTLRRQRRNGNDQPRRGVRTLRAPSAGEATVVGTALMGVEVRLPAASSSLPRRVIGLG
jgi:uncharacterized cupin superfamily protein